MRYGTRNEPNAVDWYEVATGEIVTAVGFVQHPLYDCIGVSPDGYVGARGRIEVKCPASGVPHTEIPGHYLPQCLGVMHITSGEWIDYISWSPTSAVVKRLYAEETVKDWARMEAELIEFYEKFVLADCEPPRKRRSK